MIPNTNGAFAATAKHITLKPVYFRPVDISGNRTKEMKPCEDKEHKLLSNKDLTMGKSLTPIPLHLVSSMMLLCNLIESCSRGVFLKDCQM